MQTEIVPQSNETAPVFGIVVRTNSEIAKAEAEEASLKKAIESDSHPAVTDFLGNLVEERFHEAKTARDNSGVTKRLLDCQRRRQGDYDADHLRLLQEQETSDVWIGVTETKCNACEAWMTDIDNSSAGRGWTLRATENPDLGSVIEDMVLKEVSAAVLQDIDAGHEMPSDADIAMYADQVQDEVELRLSRISKAKAKAMEQTIRDQLSEAGWARTKRDFRSDCITYGIGILKGPVVQIEKRIRWSPFTGKAEAQSVPVLSIDTPSPLDVYFSPTASDKNYGYVVERRFVSADYLYDLKDFKGYKEDAILDILISHPNGYISQIDNDSARLRNEGKAQDAYSLSKDFELLEYWGPVAGRVLKDMGIKNIIEAKTYQFRVTTCCGRVIQLIANPSPLGTIPYFPATYKRVKGSLYGHGIPWLVRDAQDIANAAGRSLVNNMGIASGPQCVVDRAMLPPEVEITNQYPFKIWLTDSSLPDRPVAGGHQPVYYFQPNSNASELIGIEKEAERMADNASGVPSYSYGSDQAGGAAETASGLSMLLNAAGRGIKDSLANMDVAISALIKNFYVYNMLLNPDDSIKGDCEVVTTGTIGVLVQEFHHMRIAEFLERLGNPLVTQTVGPMPYLETLREYGELIQVDLDGKLPPKEEIMAMLEQQKQQAEQMQQQVAAVDTESKAAKTNLDTAKAEQLRAKADKETVDAGINKARAVNELAQT